MNEIMRIYEEETGAENTRILFGQDKLWKYIDWLEARCQRLFTESEKAKIAFQLLKKAVDELEGTESYNTVMWDEKKELFVLTITDNSGMPFKIRLTEDATIQLIEDIEKDYYNRHNCKPLDTDEIIYVIEYEDITGSGIDCITTKEHEAITRWKAITTNQHNLIRFTYSEYTYGIRKVVDRYDSQKGKN
jgi:hypothetical protein